MSEPSKRADLMFGQFKNKRRRAFHAVSRHLKILREKALVNARRDAQTIYYSVCTDNGFARILIRLFEEQEADRVTLNLNEIRS